MNLPSRRDLHQPGILQLLEMVGEGGGGDVLVFAQRPRTDAPLPSHLPIWRKIADPARFGQGLGDQFGLAGCQPGCGFVDGHGAKMAPPAHRYKGRVFTLCYGLTPKIPVGGGRAALRTTAR